MENIDYKNLIKNIIKFNEIFGKFEDNVANMMEIRKDYEIDISENIKILKESKKHIDRMIINIISNDIRKK